MDWSEYCPVNVDYSPWAKQKTAMITKCATSVLIREAFGISGLYDEAEIASDSLNTNYAQIPQNEAIGAPMDPLATKIAEANSIAELEALKPEITKSKSNDMVKAYAQRQKELQNALKTEVGLDYLKDVTATKDMELGKKDMELGKKDMELTPEELDAEDRERADKQAVLDDEANRIKELKEEV